MNQRTRKLMTMQKVFHPRDDRDIQYLFKKKGEGNGLPCIEICGDAILQGLENCIKNSQENLITTDIIAMVTCGKTEQQILRKICGKKNNCIDISSNKLERLDSSIHVHA